MSRMDAKPPRARKPPTPEPKEMMACFCWLEKLYASIPHKQLISTIEAAGIPRNAIGSWRKGRPVRLDHAWLLARYLNKSLEWMANDDAPIHPAAASPRPAEGTSELEAEMEPTKAKRAAPKRLAASSKRRAKR